MKRHTNNLIRTNWKQVVVASITCLMICSVAAQSKLVTVDSEVKKILENRTSLKIKSVLE